jgi:hypothetical protein
VLFYTARYRLELKKIENGYGQLREFELKWGKEAADRARYELDQKRMGIRPTVPKQKLSDQFETIKVTAPDGTEHEFYVVPGRNGGFDFKPANPLAPDPRELSKQKIEAARLKDSREERILDAAVKILAAHKSDETGKPTITSQEARQMAMDLVGGMEGGESNQQPGFVPIGNGMAVGPNGEIFAAE